MAQANTAALINIKADVPVILFPVRIETRFSTAAGAQLLVRVYPDDIHVDTHEDSLTPDEDRCGKEYWLQVWNATNSPEVEQSAWALLVSKFQSTRSAWIVEKLRPRNFGSRPPAGNAAKPDFPALTLKDGSWTRAPQTNVLPDHWIAIGYLEGKRVFESIGEKISDIVAVGPAPKGSVQKSNSSKLAIDDGMRWMVDFDEAVKKGMALRISLSQQIVSKGLDRLLVFGVKASLDSAASAKRMAALCDAHHYTRGLAFVPQGTPSNNGDTTPSGFAAREKSSSQTLGIEQKSPLFKAGDGSDGDLVSKALGISESVLCHIEGAGNREQVDAKHINAALWAPTWGYFLDQMLSIEGQDAAIAETRRHFIDFVRARGPLPALRFGNQPYGLLPILPLDRWAPVEETKTDATIVKNLGSLRTIWQRSVKNVPKVGPGADAEGRLIEVLGMSPNSLSYAVRGTISRHLLQSLSTFLNLNLPDAMFQQQRAMSVPVLSKLALQLNPRLAELSFSPEEADLIAPFVIAGEDDDHLTPNYIQWLQRASFEEIQKEALPGGAKLNILLFLLLRHAALLEYANAGERVLMKRKLIRPADRSEPEFLDITGQGSSATIWRHLKNPVPELTGKIPLQTFLDKAKSDDPDVANLIEFKRSLANLADRSPDVLAQLLKETLDLASYRLDAWITSYATRRLHSIRRQKPVGCYLGGYAWVENLRPAQTGGVRPGESQGQPVSAGYVMAPSLPQAATAAILRAGYMSHANEGATNPFAINLSSKRVRLAVWILDGIRRGLSAGALLGYSFERGLQENHPQLKLAKFIPAFRKLAPPAARTIGNSGTPLLAESLSQVVDGLSLNGLWRKGSIDFSKPGLPNPATQKAEHTAIVEELKALDDAIDAVSDATLAESMYQLVQGNSLRAGSTLESLGLGELPPPELEVVRTPRTGSSISHRVIAIFPTAKKTSSPWVTSTLKQPRAQAEPVLNAWAGEILGDPSQVHFRAEYHESADEQKSPAKISDFHLGELGLCPLDFVYLAGLGNGLELHSRLVLHAQKSVTGAFASMHVRLKLSRDPARPAAILSVNEFIDLAHSIHQLIIRSRALKLSDLSHPSESSAELGPTEETARELTARANNAVSGLRKILTILQSTPENDLKAQELALMQASNYGVNGAFSSEPGKRLMDRVNSAISEISSRMADVDAQRPEEAHADRQIRILNTVLGGEFRVLPQMRWQGATPLKQSFSQTQTLQRDNLLFVDTWAQCAGRVRGAAQLLQRVRTCANAVSRPIKLTVGQLPHVPGDVWAALPSEQGKAPPGARISFVACLQEGVVTAEAPVCGLMIDEWHETIPSKDELPAVSFHFNRPDAQAPQAVLLAVPPDSNARWDVSTLEATVLEAAELTAIRGVDPDSLDEVGHFLPALYFALNSQGDTASLDFDRLTQTLRGDK